MESQIHVHDQIQSQWPNNVTEYQMVETSPIPPSLLYEMSQLGLNSSVLNRARSRNSSISNEENNDINAFKNYKQQTTDELQKLQIQNGLYLNLKPKSAGTIAAHPTTTPNVFCTPPRSAPVINKNYPMVYPMTSELYHPNAASAATNYMNLYTQQLLSPTAMVHPTMVYPYLDYEYPLMTTTAPAVAPAAPAAPDPKLMNLYYNYNKKLLQDESPSNLQATHLTCANGDTIAIDSNCYQDSQFDENADPFTIGDDVVFCGELYTIVCIDWQSDIAFATIRRHTDNIIIHVPIVDLQRLPPQLKMTTNHSTHSMHSMHSHHSHHSHHSTDSNFNFNNNSNTPKFFNQTQTQPKPKPHGNKYFTTHQKQNQPQLLPLQQPQLKQNLNANSRPRSTATSTANNNNTNQTNNDVNLNQTSGNNGYRRNLKLTDEALMKLPHLRKHREYLKTINVNMGPKDYNAYRVSVHSSVKDGSKLSATGGAATGSVGVNNTKEEVSNGTSNSNGGGSSSNDGYYKYTNSKDAGHSHGNEHISHNLGKRMNVSVEKCNLFKTELCENFMKRGRCTYGKKCHFAHGRTDIRNRWRIENYKTQPCCDPARAQSRLCLFGKRCNYAHPGEPLRRAMPKIYLDEEYDFKIEHDYGEMYPFPFGIYI